MPRRKYRASYSKQLISLLFAGFVMWSISSVIDSGRATAQSKPAISSSARSTADGIFGDRCAVCHGANGDGNGPGAANLNPKPKDFRDRKWQRSVTDEIISKAIVYGGPAVGLSAAMAANPDLETQPQVVAALVEPIRGLASKPKH